MNSDQDPRLPSGPRGGKKRCATPTSRFSASAPSPNEITTEVLSSVIAPDARNGETLTIGRSSRRGNFAAPLAITALARQE
jgi:hypothetical protein